MKPTTPDLIRNVALISHGGAGKTSLAEAMLFDAGAISRLGNVESGTTALDWDPDEQTRGAEHQPRRRLARARRRADHARRHARVRRLPGRRRRGAGGRRRGDRRGRRLGRRRGRDRGGLEARGRARAAAHGLHQQDGPRERELRHDPRPAQGALRPEDRARVPADRLGRVVPGLRRRDRGARDRLRERPAEARCRSRRSSRASSTRGATRWSRPRPRHPTS